ncbi:hypothetical protein [Achromobacter sp. K91]|uniref:hypothetical protein n=1 Tax=Achromobacter sp. K91 TaxID=2292262 RepID=UPI0011C3E458|nr:hypothetical protein [Achromobacter sp. K91]
MAQSDSKAAGSTYCVVFEISNERAVQLTNFLREQCPAVCPLTQSAWMVRSEMTTEQLRDELRQFAPDKTDRVYVFNTGGIGAWRNPISDKHTDWLKKYL